MNIKQMALKRTVIFLGLAALVGVANTVAIHYFGIEIVGIIWAVILFVYMSKFIYDTELSRLERDNILKKIKDSQ